MTIMDIILNLQRYSTEVLAYKLDAEFAAAVDAAANLLEAQGERIADLENELRDERYRHDRLQDFEVAEAEELRKARDGNRWIPVTERLPDESGKCIVCCDDSECPYGEGIWYQSGVVVIADVDVGIYGGICWEWTENGTIYDLEGVVTHWMPLRLPEPPGEG